LTSSVSKFVRTWRVAASDDLKIARGLAFVQAGMFLTGMPDHNNCDVPQEQPSKDHSLAEEPPLEVWAERDHTRLRNFFQCHGAKEQLHVWDEVDRRKALNISLNCHLY
jgi:hypothetical protein